MATNAQHLITPLYSQAYLADNLADLAQILSARHQSLCGTASS